MDIQQSNDQFSTATLLYARLRRVTSRVIDVMYLSENNDYAHYVVNLALAIDDAELHHLAHRIKDLLPQNLNQIESELSVFDDNHSPYNMQSTNEELIRQQVEQCYISGLR